MMLSAIGFNGFEEKIDIDGKPLIVRYKNYIKGVKTQLQEDPEGKPIITLKASSGMDTVDLTLKEGTVEDFGSFVFLLKILMSIKEGLKVRILFSSILKTVNSS